MKAKVKHIVLEVFIIDKIDGVNESNKIDKYKGIVLL